MTVGGIGKVLATLKGGEYACVLGAGPGVFCHFPLVSV